MSDPPKSVRIWAVFISAKSQYNGISKLLANVDIRNLKKSQYIGNIIRREDV